MASYWDIMITSTYGQNTVRDLFCNEPVIINFFNRRIRRMFLWNAERWKNVPANAHNEVQIIIFSTKIPNLSLSLDRCQSEMEQQWREQKNPKNLKNLKNLRNLSIVWNSRNILSPLRVSKKHSSNSAIEEVDDNWFVRKQVPYGILSVHSLRNVRTCWLS